MTRFARAKGSKACNEKTPEDSTPWEIMKEQLINSKQQNIEAAKRKQAEEQRIENYDNFLKEQKIKKRKVSWCEFPETKKKTIVNTVEKTNILENDSKSTSSTKSHKKKKIDNTEDSKSNHLEIKKSKKDKKNKKKIINDNPQNADVITDNTLNINTSSEAKKHKNKVKKINKAKKNKEDMDSNGSPRRRRPSDKNFKLIINGKGVDLVRYDGFPIMTKDAERIEELKNSMIKNGIPKSEVQRTIKLERRRAEKALSKLKKEVCYNCRKGGHNLSDCPELKSKIPGADIAEGVCFKCGSTEHKQFECKVQSDKGYRFATCFFCKEPGHIARQCPDNPRGLYPNGGSCKLCGDVTHLKKDCPTVKEQKTESKFKLQTMNTAENVEDIDNSSPSESCRSVVKAKKKKVMF